MLIVAITVGIAISSFSAVQFNAVPELCEQHTLLQDAAVHNETVHETASSSHQTHLAPFSSSMALPDALYSMLSSAQNAEVDAVVFNVAVSTPACGETFRPMHGKWQQPHLILSSMPSAFVDSAPPSCEKLHSILYECSSMTAYADGHPWLASRRNRDAAVAGGEPAW